MSEGDRHDPIQGKIVHEYDGILEADNQLPRWWLGIFLVSVIFALGYWLVYSSWHFARTPHEQYVAELAASAASGGPIRDETIELLARDPAVVDRGRAAYEANCVVCHGASGEGNIGPNLTDDRWIHGGDASSIYRTVREGVGARGMPSWGPVLGERQVQALAAYVTTLRGQNVPGRAPEGEPWAPGAQATAPQPSGPAPGI